MKTELKNSVFQLKNVWENLTSGMHQAERGASGLEEQAEDTDTKNSSFGIDQGP